MLLLLGLLLHRFLLCEELALFVVGDCDSPLDTPVAFTFGHVGPLVPVKVERTLRPIPVMLQGYPRS